MRNIVTGVATLVFTGLLALTASAAPPNSSGAFVGATPVSGQSASDAGAQPDVAAVSPFTAVNLRGGTTAAITAGACPGVTCSVALCACTTFNGTLSGAGYGKVTAAIQITKNDTDSTSTGGSGSCFPATGTATLTTAALRPSVAVLGLSGTMCQFQTVTAQTVNGNFTYAQEAATGGTNKFATAFGAGNISLVESFDQAASDSVVPSAVSAVGTLQLRH